MSQFEEGQILIVGVPKEIKANENRVAVTPSGAHTLVDAGHRVIVERNAGAGSGFGDEEYQAAGAEILEKNTAVFEAADMIVKVKEPLAPEYDLLREGQILFTYLHLAPEPELTEALMRNKVVSIAYETVQLPNGSLPLLTPMSEVAGRMATQIGAHLLEKYQGGRGVLLGGVPGVPPADVCIIGGGVVGTNAAKIAVGMGANVVIVDISADRLRYLDDIFYGKVVTMMSSPYNIAAVVAETDLLIGGVLVAGARAPRLVTEEMVKPMRPGSVIVDVAIDQGGCVETIDRVTTHAEPTYTKHGVVHYSVANMPGAVPRTSTLGLTNVTLPYALAIANKGWRKAIADHPELAYGVNCVDGACSYRAVAEAHGLDYIPLAQISQ